MRKKLLSLLVLLCLTVSSAWAQEGTLLTTILSEDHDDFTSGNKTFDNIATVTFSGFGAVNDDDEWGWYSDEGCTLTVTAAEGYTITRVKFYTDSGSAFDEEAPFEAFLDEEYYTKVNGTSIGNYGVTKIEVYGYAGTSAPASYNVTFKAGTEDATSWQGKAGEGVYQALPLEGVAAGTAVTVKYNGTKKVKSVTVVKKAELLSLTVSDDEGYIDGLPKTIYYVAGETWGQAIANHPTENAGWIYFDNGTYKYPTFTGYKDDATVCYDDDDSYDYVYDDSVIDGTVSYFFEM